MSEERAVQVVVLDGVVCTEERDYLQACQQLEQSCKLFQKAQIRIIAAWYKEHYPELRIRFKEPALDLEGGSFNALVVYVIENLDPSQGHALNEELIRYFRTLRASQQTS